MIPPKAQGSCCEKIESTLNEDASIFISQNVILYSSREKDYPRILLMQHFEPQLIYGLALASRTIVLLESPLCEEAFTHKF